ncbi:MAG: hypothetical protein ACLRFH_00305 [Opitutales bacterium]
MNEMKVSYTSVVNDLGSIQSGQIKEGKSAEGRSVQQNSTPIVNGKKMLQVSKLICNFIKSFQSFRKTISIGKLSTSIGSIKTSSQGENQVQQEKVISENNLQSEISPGINTIEKKSFGDVVRELKEIINQFKKEVKTLLGKLTFGATKTETNIPAPMNKMELSIVDTFSKLVENNIITISTKAAQKFNAASDRNKINIATEEVYKALNNELRIFAQNENLVKKEESQDILNHLNAIESSKKPLILKALKTIELYNRYDLGNGEKFIEPYPKKDFNIDQELEKLKEQGFSDNDIEILRNRAQNVKSAKGTTREDMSLRVFFGIKLELAIEKQDKFTINKSKCIAFEAEQLDDFYDLMQKSTTTQADIDKFFKDVELFNLSPY